MDCHDQRGSHRVGRFSALLIGLARRPFGAGILAVSPNAAARSARKGLQAPGR
jgi:hypothetical protein